MFQNTNQELYMIMYDYIYITLRIMNNQTIKTLMTSTRSNIDSDILITHSIWINMD